MRESLANDCAQRPGNNEPNYNDAGNRSEGNHHFDCGHGLVPNNQNEMGTDEYDMLPARLTVSFKTPIGMPERRLCCQQTDSMDGRDMDKLLSFITLFDQSERPYL
jgi:hypothetical protein